MVKRKNNTTVRRRARFDTEEGVNYTRSRTISNYNPAESVTDSEVAMERKLEQKQSSKKRRKVIVFGVITAVFGLFLLLITQFTVGVSNVEYGQPGVIAKRDNEYLSFTNQYLTEHPSERFSWLFNDNEFLILIKEQFPEILDVSIKNDIISGNKIVISLREAVAVWRYGDNRSYVDSSGAVFADNYFSEPNIVITDQNSSGQVSGISSRMLEFIGKIISGVESSGVGSIREVSIPVSAARYIEIKLAGRDFYIKIQIDRDVDSQIADIKNMITFLDKKKIKPSYVDVRVKNRGFWK